LPWDEDPGNTLPDPGNCDEEDICGEDEDAEMDWENFCAETGRDLRSVTVEDGMGGCICARQCVGPKQKPGADEPSDGDPGSGDFYW